MQDYRIALWSMNLGHEPHRPEDFAARIEQRLEAAAGEGARLLIMPEYAIEACLAYKPQGLDPREEIAFLAREGTRVVDLLAGAAQRHGVSLLLGSMPVETGGAYRNTSILLTADGRTLRQEKLCLTPGEQDPQSWQLQPGTAIRVFELDGLRLAILICLDVEVPALSCVLAKADLDLILVPSMTERLAGYHRVYGCAKARAIELMTAVAVCGCIGAAKGTTQNPSNFSGAALYLPCEEELGHSGRGAELSPVSGDEGEDLYLLADVPVAAIRALKAGGAEVWPGAWNGQHVNLIDYA